jgi:integrase
LFPALRGGYIQLHNVRAREWKPVLRAAGIEPERRIYDLRHTYATFSLAAGVSLFTLSRRMGTSVEMIDRTYGHLAPHPTPRNTSAASWTRSIPRPPSHKPQSRSDMTSRTLAPRRATT